MSADQGTKRGEVTVTEFRARGSVLRLNHPGDLGFRLFAGASATERSDVAAGGPLTSVSLVCLVASEPVACRSGS